VARHIISLPRVIQAPEGKPVRPEAEANQRLMASILQDSSTWTPGLAVFTGQVFDALSASWVDERSSYRPAPLLDALARGDVGTGERCLEIGSGTGVLTAGLLDTWSEVVCADLSLGMMTLSQHSCNIQADAGLLPFPNGAFDAVAIGDAPMFVEETIRVLAREGTLVWSNALGAGAPYYLPTEDLFDALVAAAPDSNWSAITSEALWGSWIVFRRHPSHGGWSRSRLTPHHAMVESHACDPREAALRWSCFLR
jgi:SAM-dependent methyltransferase